ncbi:MAG TPA: multiheme c-type cytochrome [Blastocatellia bacterium]|nr:multiheme c-type cytochrome [Blastocatellia bacterium]
MSNSKRIISLTVVCLFALAAILIDRASTRAFSRTQTPQPPPKPQQEREALAKKPAPSGTLEDRLDKDDGYGIALFYSMGIRGNLEVCGCPIHPLGGVARRMGYINAFRKRSPDAAILQVDAGYIFSDDLNLDGTELRADAKLMNDWIVRANEAMGLDVVNLGFRDLLYAGYLLKPDANLKPEKSSLISANVKPMNAGGADHVSPAPYVIKIVTGKRLPQPVRIAFIGLSDVAPDERKDQVAKSGFVIDDPLTAARAALDEVRDKADVTVIVGYLRLPTANKLAMRNPDLDLIIAAEERGIVFDPKQVNNTLIVYANKETKHLGELRFYTDADGVVERFTARYVELDEIIPDDKEMAEITASARKEIDVVQTRLAEEEAVALAGKPLNTPFTLSESCAQCHKEEYEVWKNSRHSHAFAALEEKQRMFDSNCVGCHSLGFRDQGFVSVKATPQFANVHCESCHGPGSEHIKAPTAGNYKTPPKNQSCLVCHDRDNSPDFDFEKYWPVIAHKNSFKPEAAPAKERQGDRETRRSGDKGAGKR